MADDPRDLYQIKRVHETYFIAPAKRAGFKSLFVHVFTPKFGAA